ncbi:MAG: hypothetical protein KGD64_00575 [Candidatus Heimdallarchaeota archaeon]|nr:hypothetical protein [Candidatus Heimdallarchaeota archaeon]
MSDFNKRNIECVMAILKEKNPATTKEILALTDKFPDLCVGCSSGGDVIMAGKELVEQGVLERNWTSEGYAWKLIDDA